MKSGSTPAISHAASRLRPSRTRPSASSTIGCNSQVAHPAYASPPRILSAPAWPNGVPAKSPSAGDMAVAIGLGGRSVRRRLEPAGQVLRSWWGEPIGTVTEIVPRFAFNFRHCLRTPAPSGQKKCPERTGLLLGTERHWSHFGEHQRLSGDPAPPAPLLVRGFGGGGASRFNPARNPNHVSQETLI